MNECVYRHFVLVISLFATMYDQKKKRILCFSWEATISSKYRHCLTDVVFLEWVCACVRFLFVGFSFVHEDVYVL